MARIELSNIVGSVSTLSLTTTGTSGASTLVGSTLNIPIYQGALTLSTAGTSGASTLVGNTLTIPTYQGQISLTTTGTSGASSLVGNTLNIPQYQGGITLTTTGTSGAATLVGTTLNIPQYIASGAAPAGSTGQIQYNEAGAFGASSNLAWDNSNVRLNIGTPSTPTGRLNVRGGGTTSATATQVWTNSGNTELMRVTDDGNVGIGTNNPTAALTIGPSQTFTVSSSGITIWGVTNSQGFLSWDTNLAIFGGRQNSDVQFRTNGITNVMRLTTGGRVGIGTTTPDASSILTVTSTTGGILFPRMTTTQRDAITTPANGLVIYNSTTDKLQVRAGGAWVDLH